MSVTEPDRRRLAHLPTPLVRAERLSTELDAEVWIKRDDLTGMELTGNKVRKLEFVLAEAISQGCDTVVTEGTSQSNHCRATAAASRKLGLKCVLLLRPEPPAGAQGNHLLDVLFSAETRCYPRDRFEAERESIVRETLAELSAAGSKPFWIPMGASDPTGCWGYIQAAAELAEQVEAANWAGCDVVCAVSSGGTYAGLVLGKLLYGLDRLELVGVPVSDDVAYHQRELGGLCRATIACYGLPIQLEEKAFTLTDGYVGDGYAIPYAAAMDALRLVASLEGILLDPVYTAKAFCALVDGVRAGRWGRRRPVVFLHTGGAFSNFAWPETLLT